MKKMQDTDETYIKERIAADGDEKEEGMKSGEIGEMEEEKKGSIRSDTTSLSERKDTLQRREICTECKYCVRCICLLEISLPDRFPQSITLLSAHDPVSYTCFCR